MRILLYLIIDLLLATLLVCSMASNDPGGIPTGSEMAFVIKGTLTNDCGIPATGAQVTMRPRMYLSGQTTLGKRVVKNGYTVYTTVTDKQGRYMFTREDSVQTGIYCIEAVDPALNHRIFIDSIVINPPEEACSTWLRIASPNVKTDCILRAPGTIEGNIPLPDDSSKMYVRVFGLDRVAEVGRDGTFTLDDMPQGRYRLVICSLRNNSLYLTMNVDVLTGKTTIADTASIYGYSDNQTRSTVRSRYSGMVLIPAGGNQFIMGDSVSPDGRPHRVTFTKNFWIDTTEVTQKEYQTVMASIDRRFILPLWTEIEGIGDHYPAYYVSWYDAALYCNARTKMTGSADTVYKYSEIKKSTEGVCTSLEELEVDLDRSGFRLPSEAQWEYACRGGTTTSYYWDKNYGNYPLTVEDSTEIDRYAFWARQSYYNESGIYDLGAKPVALKKKNLFGLYDMSGNVWEWCNDWYDNFTSYPQVDPIGDTLYKTYRVVRGGGWDSDASSLCSSLRNCRNPDSVHFAIGFRVCLPAK